MGILSLIVWPCVAVFIIYICKKVFNSPKTPLTRPMNGKVVIVTGSNTGIGKETAIELVEQGAKVIFACRNEEKTTEAINSIKSEKLKQNALFMKLDLSSFTSIVQFVEEFKKSFSAVDLLINNAGAVFDGFGKVEGIERTIMVNHIGPVFLTALILPLINAEGKVINVSSMGGKHVSQKKFDEFLQDETFQDTAARYNMLTFYIFTKLCNIHNTIHLDQFLRKNDFKVKTASIHPGYVKTELARPTSLLYKILIYSLIPFAFVFAKDSKMGAQTTLHVAYMDYNSLESAAYFNDCHEEKLNQVAESPDNVKRTMAYTKNLIIKIAPEIPEVQKYFS